jgi:hypothetical protein
MSNRSGSRSWYTVSPFSALFFVVASVASSKKSDGAPILRDFGFISEINQYYMNKIRGCFMSA